MPNFKNIGRFCSVVLTMFLLAGCSTLVTKNIDPLYLHHTASEREAFENNKREAMWGNPYSGTILSFSLWACLNDYATSDETDYSSGGYVGVGLLGLVLASETVLSVVLDTLLLPFDLVQLKDNAFSESSGCFLMAREDA